MKRKIYDEMLEWKNEWSDRTSLLIDGARRVGKSYIAEEFAKNEYRSYIMVDFGRAADEVMNLFKLYLNDLDTFFMYLSTYYNVKLYERESVIIFDEVQLFPQARGAIKYLVADGRYDYIETGSLMSIKKNVKDIVIPSEERHISLYPLDFEEFLWALGNDTMMKMIRKCYAEKKPMGQVMHRRAMDLFRQYMLVGGMPQVVEEYAASRDWNRIDRLKRDILSLYREDIIKHASGYEMKVESIFDEIPDQLQRRESHFKFSSIRKEARYREYKDALYWLDDAMIVNICYNSTAPDVGLKLNMDRMTLKCYMADVNPWNVVLQEVENFKPKFAQADLSVSVQGEGANLQLDIDRFKQIMVNLLGNSIRYTEAGGEVRVHTEQSATHWSVILDDSPLGLSDEQLARLGERFYRVDDSRTRSTGGTGLGLALSGKIAQAMGGQLSFDHSPLGGLRCKLTFPKQLNK